MCELCRSAKCVPSCPNHISTEKALYICKKCGFKIQEGDFAYKIDENTIWCEVCVDDALFTA